MLVFFGIDIFAYSLLFVMQSRELFNKENKSNCQLTTTCCHTLATIFVMLKILRVVLFAA